MIEVIKVPPEAYELLSENAVQEKRQYDAIKAAHIANQRKLIIKAQNKFVEDVKFRDLVQNQQKLGLESRANRKAMHKSGMIGNRMKKGLVRP